ncbi:hypothetical protein [Agromyces aerolatus]|uniref:hypothetical protein n=1 Tax=Agromyces sp. LY-1074 TaxID=3074080 RepID=UPI002856FBE0|nr:MULTISPECIES: hypothetical protein [unclassified Agromyces]MDR5700304.1 hypothetical protein [Agromyces sp. LY-1074]MDR5706718.1 hypothetical protein [Agromyces sp. LY-1358]
MSYREPHATAQAHAGRVMGMRGCETHEACSSDRPGHGVNAVQARLAHATPSKWIDAIVVDVDRDGFIVVADLGGGIRRLWHHAALGDVLAVGEPVALHAVYGVLAHAEGRFSVADA